jgi:hypothetical protein
MFHYSELMLKRLVVLLTDRVIDAAKIIIRITYYTWKDIGCYKNRFVRLHDIKLCLLTLASV